MKNLFDKIKDDFIELPDCYYSTKQVPGTTPKTLSEEFPLCKERGLIIDYKMETGPTVTAEQVEKAIGDLLTDIASLHERIFELDDFR